MSGASTTLYYENIPFKFHIFHEYGHFTKSCPKSQQKQPPSMENPKAEFEFKIVPRKH
jgi:hypothetical protein